MRAFLRFLPLALRLSLGAVFLYSSIDKIAHPEAFAQIVHRYQLLPDALINLCALILPWLELLLAACLISGVWLPGAVLWANALLWLFFAALLFNHLRGLDIHCGCFSTSVQAGEAPIFWYLLRDGLFLLASGYLLTHLWRGARARPAPVSAADAR